ncbi:methionine synthase [Gudongella oleilytica]|uniref:methionine synthase n=1 Tax=Gudongella oleilytica TaxID=1582259 RepID=UPI002A3619AA|nr:methionine synthase [Gudongella oleilytica]MDY0257632.1 methionine synthase [Gudongella oleilytica]
MDKNQYIKTEVLRYLGYKNQDIDDNTHSLIDGSIEEIKDLSEERYTYRFFDILDTAENVQLKDSNLKLPGHDIAKHLEKSNKCVLLAVSLGHRVDTRIRYYEKTSMTKALIMDACATAAIEDACDRICKKIENELVEGNDILTSRFSPGYGDLPLEIQKDFLTTLDAKKSIGLSASASSILIPRKSVTAIVGIVKKDEQIEKRSCESCSKYLDCSYRKGGLSCGH